MAPAIKVANERHEDPKNVAKGDYSKDFFDLWKKYQEEVDELEEALIGLPTSLSSFEHARSEVGDVIVSLSMLLLKIEAMAQGENWTASEGETRES